MTHGQWKDSHDEKQARGGLRHGQMICSVEKGPRRHKSEWFFDVFLGEYTKFVGLSKINVTIKQRSSTLLRVNVGPLHITVEKWLARKVERYG
ncbi:hypothetical protein CRP114_gp7 [Roseobacter phage CRP-114]|uniref:Uncharacterized protein n=1 Tax=Roseobacter phage CRP-114 TaxID=3072842 RepID=A0AAX3ZX31_9CAUD|nr:hypothetical protein CRP114_gp7 [Roseobacter phage CRP-114]